MNLSRSFTIDPREPWVVAHNKEAREVWEAFHADRPIRVPLSGGGGCNNHGFYADEIDLDYRIYYTDPDENLRVQLESARRARELPIWDLVLAEPPEEWIAAVDLWPIPAPGWFGCQLVYRKDTVIANHRLDLSKEECDALERPDPQYGGFLATMNRYWEHLHEKYDGKLTFLGRPVGNIGRGIGHNGPLCLAFDIRGHDLMVDMYEDPDFAHRFLQKIADCCDTLERTWAEIAGYELGAFTIHDHGIDMLSPQLYEEFIVPLVLGINHRRGTTPPHDLHHCGRGVHLFPIMHKYFGLSSINALTYPLVDIAKVRRDLGEEVWITAIIDDGIIKQGPPERIREVVREFMNSGVKGKGRLSLMPGDMLRGTPREHHLAYYEAVKEFGRYH